MPYLGVLDLQFEKTIVIFEIIPFQIIFQREKFRLKIKTLEFAT